MLLVRAVRRIRNDCPSQAIPLERTGTLRFAIRPFTRGQATATGRTTQIPKHSERHVTEKPPASQSELTAGTRTRSHDVRRSIQNPSNRRLAAVFGESRESPRASKPLTTTHEILCRSEMDGHRNEAPSDAAHTLRNTTRWNETMISNPRGKKSANLARTSSRRDSAGGRNEHPAKNIAELERYGRRQRPSSQSNATTAIAGAATSAV